MEMKDQRQHNQVQVQVQGQEQGYCIQAGGVHRTIVQIAGCKSAAGSNSTRRTAVLHHCMVVLGCGLSRLPGSAVPSSGRQCMQLM